jgi:hypothetical protein
MSNDDKSKTERLDQFDKLTPELEAELKNQIGHFTSDLQFRDFEAAQPKPSIRVMETSVLPGGKMGIGFTVEEKANVLAENLRNLKYSETQTGKTGLFCSRKERTSISASKHPKANELDELELMHKLMRFVSERVLDGRDYTVRYFPIRREVVKDIIFGAETITLFREVLITISNTNEAQIGDLVAFDNSFPKHYESPVVQSDKNLGVYLHWEKEQYGWRLVKVSDRAM